MAVTNTSFTAQVDDWVKQSKERMEAAFKESCQRIVAEAQTPVGAGGNMPIVTNYLRSSGVGTIGAPTPMRKDARPEEGQTYTFSMGDVSAVISRLKIGNTFFWCYVAVYARRVEYKRGFVRLPAQRWPQIVAQVARELRTRAGE